jgi:hypothetical protein
MATIKEGVMFDPDGSDAHYLTGIMLDITAKHFVEHGIIKSAHEFITYLQEFDARARADRSVEVVLNPPKKE